MTLTNVQVKKIFDNMFQKCPECKSVMQPLSTMCGNCRAQHPPKTVIVPHKQVIEGSYYEHFEIRECTIHEASTVWFCVHPSATCTKEELRQVCTNCLRDLLNEDLK